MMRHWLRARRSNSPSRSRFHLSRLEQREVPAQFLVINTNNSGIGSLRQAVINANTTAGVDDINFSAAFNAPQTINLLTQIDITERLNLNGPGAGLLTISGNNATRIFDVNHAAQSSYINAVTLANGKTTGAADGPAIAIQPSTTVYLYDSIVRNHSSESGGAVYVNDASFYSFGSRFTDNVADLGGAVQGMDSPTMSFNLCSFERNTAKLGGGAVFLGVDPVFGATNCTFADNTAATTGGALMFDVGGQVNIHQSTFSGNKAFRGGAIEFQNEDTASLNRVIRNCTFANNTATGAAGGAINFLDLNVGIVFQIQNSTFVGNSASSKGGAVAFENAVGKHGELEMGGCIVVDNAAPTGPNLWSVDLDSRINTPYSALGECAGGIVYYANSIYPPAPELYWTPTTLKLGPLANNGGATKTVALADDSPARNRGLNYGGDTEDQRGQPRVNNGQADIGSYEARQQFVVTNTKDSGVGSLRQAILDANAFVSSGELVTFDPTVFNLPKTIALTTGGVISTGVIEIDGPGPDRVTIDFVGLESGLVFGNAASARLRGVTLTNSALVAVEANTTQFTLDNCAIVNNGSATSGTAGLFAFFPVQELTVSRCNIRNNQSPSDTDGGGIDYQTPGGVFRLVDSTIANNLSQHGGGLYVDTGTIEIINSTISSNTATGIGGGVVLKGMTAPVKIWNSTIATNSAGTQGGGVHLGGTPGHGISVVSSVIAGNNAPSAADVFTFHATSPVDARASAITNHAGIAKYNDLGGNIAPGTPLLLGPLVYNGGFGFTHVPLVGSPLINAGSNLAGLTTDQRGYARNVGGETDMGAVEVQAAPTVTIRIHDGSAQRSVVRNIDIEFSGIVNLGAGAIVLDRTGPIGPLGQVPALVVDQSTATQTKLQLRFTDALYSQFGSLIDGLYGLTLSAAHIADGSGQLLDGNADTMAGDNRIVEFHRLFGDGNGDRMVTAIDFNMFRLEYGDKGRWFDFNDDGTTAAVDFNEFRLRYGVAI